MKCTDPKIGRLLEAYEFGLLSAEERRLFDGHLLECDRCAQDVFKMIPVVEALESESERFKSLQPASSAQRSWLATFLNLPFPIKIMAYSFLALIIATAIVFWDTRKPTPVPADFQAGIFRGSLKLIEPKGEMRTIPEAFKWDTVCDKCRYQIFRLRGWAFPNGCWARRM